MNVFPLFLIAINIGLVNLTLTQIKYELEQSNYLKSIKKNK
jgi:hypothetical protein